MNMLFIRRFVHWALPYQLGWSIILGFLTTVTTTVYISFVVDPWFGKMHVFDHDKTSTAYSFKMDNIGVTKYSMWYDGVHPPAWIGNYHKDEANRVTPKTLSTSLWIEHFEKGWPFRAFQCDLADGDITCQTYSGISTIEHHHMVDLASRYAIIPYRNHYLVMADGKGVIPLQPIWLGLIADLLLWAVCWMGIISITGFVVRRLRPERLYACAVCGYDLTVTCPRKPDPV